MKKLLISIAVVLVLFAVVYAASQWFGTDGTPEDSDDVTGTGFSYIRDEASPVTGVIDSIEYFVNIAGVSSFSIGVFTKSGSQFTDIESAINLTLTDATLHQMGAPADFTEMDINEGEYVGIAMGSSGRMERNTTGGPGYWFLEENPFTGGPHTFALSGNSTYDIQYRVFITETGEPPAALLPIIRTIIIE